VLIQTPYYDMYVLNMTLNNIFIQVSQHIHTLLSIPFSPSGRATPPAAPLPWQSQSGLRSSPVVATCPDFWHGVRWQRVALPRAPSQTMQCSWCSKASRILGNLRALTCISRSFVWWSQGHTRLQYVWIRQGCDRAGCCHWMDGPWQQVLPFRLGSSPCFFSAASPPPAMSHPVLVSFPPWPSAPFGFLVTLLACWKLSVCGHDSRPHCSLGIVPNMQVNYVTWGQGCTQWGQTCGAWHTWRIFGGYPRSQGIRCALLDVWVCTASFPRSTTSLMHGVSQARHPQYAIQYTQPSLTGQCPSHMSSVSETIRRRKRTLSPGVTVALNRLWICGPWCGDPNGPHQAHCMLVRDDGCLGVGCVLHNLMQCRLARIVATWQPRAWWRCPCIMNTSLYSIDDIFISFIIQKDIYVAQYKW